MLSSQPGIAWSQIARVRDHLAHRYFDTARAVLRATVDNDLPELERAVQVLAAALPLEDSTGSADVSAEMRCAEIHKPLTSPGSDRRASARS